MATTLRAHARRQREDRLVDAIDCLDCASPRGKRCVNRYSQECVTCCQAREDFGVPIAYQLFKMAKLLDEAGLVP